MATEDYASGGSKWILDSGCTSHMTGSKEILMELRPNTNQATVTYGDKSRSKVTGLSKVVVAPNITLVNVMLVETLGYNLLSVRALRKMGFSTFFELDLVVLLWSTTLEVAFVGHVKMSCMWWTFRGQPTLKRCVYLKRPT